MSKMIRRASQPAIRLSLQIQIDPESSADGLERRQLRRWVYSSLESSAELTLRFVGLVEARQLNFQFRKRNYPTNVLTFNYDDDETLRAGATASPIRADIVICMEVLVREARAQQKRLKDHLAHLVIHGSLHAQGWDHQTRTQAAQMEQREIELLKRFGIGNPYQIS